MHPQSGGVVAGAAPASNVQASVVSLPEESSPSRPKENAPLQTNPPSQMNPASLTNISAQSNSASNSLSVAPAGASATTSRNLQPSSNPATGGGGAARSPPVPAPRQTPPKPNP